MKEARLIQVFVSSPSDVQDERDVLEGVVRSWNAAWGARLSVRLELVRWETQGYPGVGEDPQAVLNRQLPDDCEIFIGIMWGRFGTETERAGSGTEEEFTTAYARHQADPRSVQLMFYLKDAPIRPTELDPEQLTKRTLFVSKLKENGCLYWNFEKTDAFGALAHTHLSRAVQQILDQAGTAATVPVPGASDDEPGIMDIPELVDQAARAMERIRAITKRATDATSDLGTRTDRITSEMNDVSNLHVSKRQARAAALVTDMATNLSDYASRLGNETQILQKASADWYESSKYIAALASEFAAEQTEVQELRAVISELLDSIAHGWASLDDLKKVIGRLPRLSREFNRAKREAETAMDTFGSVLLSQETLGREILNLLPRDAGA